MTESSPPPNPNYAEVIKHLAQSHADLINMHSSDEEILHALDREHRNTVMTISSNQQLLTEYGDRLDQARKDELEQAIFENNDHLTKIVSLQQKVSNKK